LHADAEFEIGRLKEAFGAMGFGHGVVVVSSRAGAKPSATIVISIRRSRHANNSTSYPEF